MKNCQPFARELGGRMHVFAHNGDLDAGRLGAPRGSFRPVGDTDSERAFCVLLERLTAIWLRGGTPRSTRASRLLPDLRQRSATSVRRISSTLTPMRFSSTGTSGSTPVAGSPSRRGSMSCAGAARGALAR